MAFEIRFTTAAKRDIAMIVEHIAGESPQNAQKWVEGLQERVQTLGDMPSRHALIPEAASLRRIARGMKYHSHRVIYEVDEIANIVYVLRIYHFARDFIRITDID